MDDKKIYFETVEMKSEDFCSTRRKPKDFMEVRKNILVSLQTFLEDRFKIDKELQSKIDPFIKFEKTANIKLIHLLIAPELY